MVFCSLVGADLWIVLDMSQTSLWIFQSGYCLLCLLALQHFLATAHELRSPCVYLLQNCCYCRCCGVSPDTVTVVTAVFHCYSDKGLLACRVFQLVLLYICPQEEGAAYCQSLGCFPSKRPMWSHCDLSTMLSEILNLYPFCTRCLHCVLGRFCILKSWLDIGLIFILHLEILIDIIFLLKITHKYLAQIVIYARYCAPAWISRYFKESAYIIFNHRIYLLHF